MRHNQLVEGAHYAIVSTFNFRSARGPRYNSPPVEVFKAKFLRRDNFTGDLFFEFDASQNVVEFRPKVKPNVTELIVEAKDIIRKWDPDAEDQKAAVARMRDQLGPYLLKQDADTAMKDLDEKVQKLRPDKMKGARDAYVHLSYWTPYDVEAEFSRRRRGQGNDEMPINGDESESDFWLRMRDADWIPLVRGVTINYELAGKGALDYLAARGVV